MHGIDFIQDLAVILLVAGAVGWVCQRVGLSVVVGFVVAGILVGPHTPPFALVTDPGRIETLSQLGLVFLMFSIGLRLSLRNLRRLGLSLLIAVFLAASVVYYLARLAGLAVGFDPTESLFLAAMLMVSSSSIITKVLHEAGATHDRAGQLAMGMSVLEDVVAVVMLTILNSVVKTGGAHAAIGTTLGLLGSFIVLAGIGGLLIVPWVLRKLSVSAAEELQTLGVAGILFALAFMAFHAGYSPALGAFLLGTIVAETPHRTQVERTFEGLRDVFSAVFFVAIGMQIDLTLLWQSLGLIVGVAAFTIVVRTLAAAIGLSLTGTSVKDALRVGLSVTPIGEFSFIIAQLGMIRMAVPANFYALAVGTSLLTTLVAPLLTRNSERISLWILSHRAPWMQGWHSFYYSWLEHLQARQKRNLLWQLSRKRFVQIGVEMLFVTGLMVFSEQLLGLVEDWLGENWLFPHGPATIFWVTLTLIILAPLVAIWRNSSALCLLFAQIITTGNRRASRLRPIVEGVFKIVVGAGLYVWLSALLPVGGGAKWMLLGSGVVALVALIFLKRKLVYWHSELEIGLQDVLEGSEEVQTPTSAPWLRPHGDWNLSVIDCVLPDLAECQGKTIAEIDLRNLFGCTIVGIGRQGYMISLPSPDTALYPRDKILLLGTSEQLEAGKKFLVAVSAAPPVMADFEDVRMETVLVPSGSEAVGKDLRTLSPTQHYRVQIAGLKRDSLRLLNPGAEEAIRADDELLVLGTPDRIRDFRDWLNETPADVREAKG